MGVAPSAYSKLELRPLIDKIKALVGEYQREREIDAWFKQQAWRKVVGLLLKAYPATYDSWPNPDERKKEFLDIPADSVSELVGLVDAEEVLGPALVAVLVAGVGAAAQLDGPVAGQARPHFHFCLQRSHAGFPARDPIRSEQAAFANVFAKIPA